MLEETNFSPQRTRGVSNQFSHRQTTTQNFANSVLSPDFAINSGRTTQRRHATIKKIKVFGPIKMGN